MPDNRPLEVKLDELIKHPRTPPDERAAARAALARLQRVAARNIETPAHESGSRGLTRDAILASPDRAGGERTRRVWSHGLQMYLILDADQELRPDDELW